MTQNSIDQLFKEAVELNQAARLEFLAALPPARRSTLEGLLNSDMAAEAQGYMEPNDTLKPRADQIPVQTVPMPDQVEPLPDQTESMPDQIGPYKILQPTGKGGMGQVFMAQQTEPIKRRVAIKIIKTDTPTKEILARFEAERQALAMMNHQNIAKVLDAGITEEGRPYFAMELVKGIPITEYCDTNKLKPNERLNLFIQTCRAIQHAHQKGIIHRDIKPGNVLVTLYDGKPVAKVIDFGLAKALQDTTQLTNRTLFTQYGQVVGTLAYMSPEQAEMNTLDVDTRTDVYSLGVILYELLTGSTPITRDSMRNVAFDRILAMIREEEAPRLSTRLSESGDAIAGISEQRKTEPMRLNRLLKGDLDWIAVKALEKDRTRRYDGPSALADDVQRYLEDEPIEARPPNFRYRMQKVFRKHRVTFIAGAAIVVLLLAGLVGTGTMWLKARVAESNARAAESDAIAEAGKARDAEAEAVKARIAQTHKSFSASLNQARAQRWSRRTGQHFAAADALAQAAELLQDLELEGSDLQQRRQVLRNEFVAGMPLTDIRARPVHNRDPLWAGWEALAPDFIRRAESNAAGDIQVLEAPKVLCSFEGPRKIERLGFGPRGEFLFARYWNDKKLQLSIWSVKSGEKVLHVDEDLNGRTPVAISKSGLVAVGVHSGMVRVYSLDSGAVVNERQFDAFPYCVAFASEDADNLAVTSGKKLTIWSRSTDSTQETVTSNRLMTLAVAQGVVMVGDNVGRILQWPLDRLDSKPKEFVGHTGLVWTLFISPHDLVASSSWDGTSQLWNCTTGEQLLQVVGSELTGDLRRQGETTFCIPGFSNDGLMVATTAHPQITAFEVTHSAARRLLRNPDRTAPRVWSMAWHPDEPLLVITTGKGIDVWNPEEGRLVNQVRCEHVWTGVFINNAEHLLTSGAAGVQKWPVKTLKAGETTTLEFGEPELLAAGALDGMSVNTTLSIAALDRQNSLELLSLDGAFELVQVAQVPNLNQVVLSPDGKWLFTATWNSNGINVYDVAERKHVKTLAAKTGSATLAVSPDGRLLVASMKLLPQQVWKIGSWEKLTTLERPHSETWPGAIAFSPSGHLLAITNDRFSARILETERFADGFTLPSGAQQQSFKYLAFNPSGTMLAVAFDHAVEVWDLDEVQRRLRALDLDW
jgi:serine/threonine protein kinase/WD40 repeat protein